MIKSVGSFWVLILSSPFVLTGGTATPAADTDNAPAKIYVRVYNYAEVPGAILGAAKAEAARIYRRLGVDLEWVDCPYSADDRRDYSACLRLGQGPAVLQVKILPEMMAKRIGAPRLDFGLSMIPRDAGFAFNASIFYHRAEAIAKKGAASRAVMLGHILAHEIGHLLLGQGSHAKAGIMRVPWDKAQLRRASEGQLLFTARQAERIRTRVLKRVRDSHTLAGVASRKRD